MPIGTPAMTAINSVTLPGSSTDVTFTIPSGYRDIRFVIEGALSSGGANLTVQYNGDTSSNYSYVYMYGNGSTTGSSATGATSNFFGALWSGRGVNLLDIFDVNQTDKHKSSISRYNSAANETGAFAGRWASTAAITSVKIFTSNGTSFAPTTTFTIYGVSA